MNEIIGTYYLVSNSREEALRSLTVKDKIGAVVAQQCSVRGADRPFMFRALGFRWRYEPDPTIEPLPIVEVPAND